MMKKYWNVILTYLAFPAAGCFITACEKQHLQPDIPPGAAEPLVYISAVLGTDSVYFAGGEDAYVGEVTMTDTFLERYFNFALINELSSPLQPRPYFKFIINNSRLDLGIPEQDLDSTIFPGIRYYGNAPIGFIPFAVTVEWYDSTGTKFSTDVAAQTDDFEITLVEDISYQNKTYKKTTVEFDCILMDNTLNTISLTNGRAILLFGTN